MATTGVSPVKSIGLHGQWGLSSTFDFLEALEKIHGSISCNNDEPVRILLIQPGDIRHILCTLSKRARHKGSSALPAVHFYKLENPVEILTRDLILLELFHDFEVPIRQRATIFLEVYGNLRVQKRTNTYLEQLSQRVKRLLAKEEGKCQVSPSLFKVLEYISCFLMPSLKEY